MHYCIHLLTKQLPTEKEIEKIMEPYSWDSIDDEDTDDEKKKIEYPVLRGIGIRLVEDTVLISN